jgi:hypothetical protein
VNGTSVNIIERLAANLGIAESFLRKGAGGRADGRRDRRFPRLALPDVGVRRLSYSSGIACRGSPLGRRG